MILNFGGSLFFYDYARNVQLCDTILDLHILFNNSECEICNVLTWTVYSNDWESFYKIDIF